MVNAAPDLSLMFSRRELPVGLYGRPEKHPVLVSEYCERLTAGPTFEISGGWYAIDVHGLVYPGREVPLSRKLADWAKKLARLWLLGGRQEASRIAVPSDQLAELMSAEFNVEILPGEVICEARELGLMGERIPGTDQVDVQVGGKWLESRRAAVKDPDAIFPIPASWIGEAIKVECMMETILKNHLRSKR